MADPRPRLPEDNLFDERNRFLDLLLGLVSLSERLLATGVELAEPLPPRPVAVEPPPPVRTILR